MRDEHSWHTLCYGAAGNCTRGWWVHPGAWIARELHARADQDGAGIIGVRKTGEKERYRAEVLQHWREFLRKV